MKFLLPILCAAALAGCEQSPNAWSPVPISVTMLRKESVERKMRILKETAFLGDAELGIQGGPDVLRELSAQSKDEFPDGEYVYLENVYSARPGISGYVLHGPCWINWNECLVYRKIEVEPTNP